MDTSLSLPGSHFYIPLMDVTGEVVEVYPQCPSGTVCVLKIPCWPGQVGYPVSELQEVK